jgi:hypothetical protein
MFGAVPVCALLRKEFEGVVRGISGTRLSPDLISTPQYDWNLLNPWLACLLLTLATRKEIIIGYNKEVQEEELISTKIGS